MTVDAVLNVPGVDSNKMKSKERVTLMSSSFSTEVDYVATKSMIVAFVDREFQLTKSNAAVNYIFWRAALLKAEKSS